MNDNSTRISAISRSERVRPWPIFGLLDNELRKKASTSDIDPAIRGLNTQLGAAREKMQETTEAGAEAWSAAQDEANKAFDALRKNAAELSARLQKELGIDEA